MKDIVITPRRQKTEIIIFCSCVAIAAALNIYAIIRYQTEWSELWTQFFWMLSIGIFIYAVSVVLRILFKGVKSLYRIIRNR